MVAGDDRCGLERNPGIRQERLKKNRKEPVVELAVDYAVSDIAECVIEVQRR